MHSEEFVSGKIDNNISKDLKNLIESLTLGMNFKDFINYDKYKKKSEDLYFVLNNLSIKLSKNGYEYLNPDRLSDMFWIYFDSKKNIPKKSISNKFEVKLNLNGSDKNINFDEYVIVLNNINRFINENINQIKNFNACFYNEKNLYKGDKLENYMEEQKKLYDCFLHTRFKQYKKSIDSGNIDPKSLVFYFILLNKLGLENTIDFSKFSKLFIIFSGLKINVMVFLEMIYSLKLHDHKKIFNVEKN